MILPCEAQLVDSHMRFFRGLATEPGDAGDFLFFDMDEFDVAVDITLQQHVACTTCVV
jgi:hypothetical protein